MAIQHRTYLDSPSTGFLRTVVILSTILACTSAFAFLSSLIGALFLGSYDNPLRAIIYTLISLTEAAAMIIFIIFFRQDHVRKNTKMFAYPVVLYSLSNLLFVIHAYSNWKWDSLVYAISFILLALVAADCYYGFKRVAFSLIALIFTGACHLISIIYALIVMIIAFPGQTKLSVIVVSFLISIYSTLPYLIMILYLRERIVNKARLMIHPELRRAAALIRFFWPSFTERKFRLAKVANEKLKGKCRSPLAYEQVSIARRDNSQLRLCIYSPLEPKADVPGLLWLHGGGYALGTPEQDELFIQRFIHASNCVVVAPDYRLSIDAPYPAALEDGYAALLWLKEHGPAYGVRTDQLMVGGDSAGGGLAVALTLYARDQKEVAIAFQMPLYPMLDDRMNTPSATENDGPLWNSKSNATSWRLYLGTLFQTDQVPVYAAPARCRDLTGLPPACSYVGSIEPFHDEVVDYFKRLRATGTEVHMRVFDGCFHGFDIICAKTGIANAARDFLMTHFLYATEHYFAAQPPGGKTNTR